MLSKFLSFFRLSKGGGGGSFDVIYENQWKNKPKRDIFKVFRIATKIYFLVTTEICLNTFKLTKSSSPRPCHQVRGLLRWPLAAL